MDILNLGMQLVFFNRTGLLKPPEPLHFISDLGEKFMFVKLSVRGKEKVRWQWMIQNIKTGGQGIGSSPAELERKKTRPLR